MNSKLNHPRNSFAPALLGCLVVAALSTILAAAPPKGANMKVGATVKSPDIIAVRVRHDMCPLCRELDPQFPYGPHDHKNAAPERKWQESGRNYPAFPANLATASAFSCSVAAM